MRELSLVLSPGGWPYASATSQAQEDPGRYHALFGRDSLITSLQLLPVRPEVARATLRALAALQGRREDRHTGEQPGKIVHEYRSPAPRWFVEQGWPVRRGQLCYYGSSDATAWFAIVMAALDEPEVTEQLERSWRAAGHWLLEALEQGDGLLRHEPTAAPGGLIQQGWRDSVNPTAPDGGGILHADGSIPAVPLADADTQATALAALRALTRLSGGDRTAPAYAARADQLATTIRNRFDAETMALDADDRPVRGAGSQLGWLLWAGADLPGAAERLAAPDVMTPWGLRTLSDEHPQFHPTAYHRGAVWPFDSWIGWGGLRAAGRHADAERLRTGVLAALDKLGEAPELYAVTPGGPRRIAISNHVQAWTIGARWALEHHWDGRTALTPRATA